MRIFLDCIPCFVRQVLDSVRLTTDDEDIQIRVLRQALRLAAEMDLTQSPPVMGLKIHRFIRELTENPDPYREVKSRFNAIALRMYPDLRALVDKSPDPLETAVQLAVAGNIIDFGVNSEIEEQGLEEASSTSLNTHLSLSDLEDFKDAIGRAESILYIADNAGEIVFDRLLIEELPAGKTTCVVRRSAILNDDTIEDARSAGITDIVETIDNGSDAPGTILEECSDAFRSRFRDAGLIIAKGQGNYETLSDIDKNIFFILRAKCPVIAADLGCEVGEMVLQRSRVFNDTAGLIKESE